jgi:hypothetical protein
MADFAPNYTARYRVRYTSQGKSHATTWRVASSVTDPTAVAAKFGLFLEDMEGSLWDDWTVVGADFALADTDVFLPAPPPDQPTGAVAVSGATMSDSAFAISFVCRSALGGKGRFFLYGTNDSTLVRDSKGNDFKLLSSESVQIADAVTRLNETSPVLVCNDDSAAVFYDYVNMKHNDRWVRRLRRG